MDGNEHQKANLYNLFKHAALLPTADISNYLMVYKDKDMIYDLSRVRHT